MRFQIILSVAPMQLAREHLIFPNGNGTVRLL